jgi:ubiquinone/menaquinone biosynthesis C-methylase UbiE
MAQQAQDTEKIKHQMRGSWNDSSTGWRKWWRIFEKAAQPVSDRMVELAQIGPGSRVLELATGIGEPAMTAARKVAPGGIVVATDLSPGMLEGARERANAAGIKNIIFREADAEKLEIPERDFDAALCRWGLMFMPNLEGALRRVRELLVDGGRFAISVWDKEENVPIMHIASDVARKLANLPPPPPGALDPCRLSDIAALGRTFEQAGFKDFYSEQMTIVYEFESPEQFATFRSDTAAPFRRMMEGLDVDLRERIMKAIIEEVRRQCGSGAFKLDNSCFCAVARR